MGKVRTILGLSGAALLASIAIGMLAGLSGYTFVYAEGASYMSNDPKACINCHVMRDQYDSWEKSPHHAVATCNDCHVPHDLVGKYMTKADHGFRHSKGFTLQDFHEPIQIKSSSLSVVQDNCLRCHQELTSEMSAHVGAMGKTETTSCTHCHAGIGHGPRR